MVGQGFRSNDDGAGMNARIPYRSFQFSCIFQRCSYERVFRFESGFQFRYVLDHVVNRDFLRFAVFFRESVRNHFGQTFGLGQRKALYTCYVFYGAFGGHGTKRYYVAYLVDPVFVFYVFQHFGATVIGKINVDIGQGYPFFVQKPLKQQSVFDGIH